MQNTRRNHPLEGLRLAFVTRNLPLGSRSGSSTYVEGLLTALTEAGALVRVLVTDAPEEAAGHWCWRPPHLIRRGCSLRVRGRVALGAWQFTRPSPPATVLRTLKARLRPARPNGSALGGWPSWDREVDAGEAAYLRAELTRFQPHAVIANYAWMLTLFREWPEPRPAWLRIVLTHDIRHLDCRLHNGVVAWLERTTYPRERELAELRIADVVAAIQPREAAWFQEMLPDKRVITVGLPVPPRLGATRRPVTHRCLCVGSDNATNAESIRWFLDQIWPQVLRAHPQASLHLCGKVASNRALAELPTGVVRRGLVDDLAAEYSSAALALAPLRSGSGLKIKVVEALAHGCPVVGTSVAFDGVPGVEGPLSPCDTEEAFAARVIQLMDDPELRGRAEGLAKKIVTQHYGLATCVEPLVQVLRPLLGAAAVRPQS